VVVKIKYLIILFFLFSCASTGVKKDADLQPDRTDKANVYFKRPAGVLWFSHRAFIVVNGTEVGSLNMNEQIKVYLDEGEHNISVNGESIASFNPVRLAKGKEIYKNKFEKGKNYYFIVNTSMSKTFDLVNVTSSQYTK
jgi:hypothetical protein